MSSKVRVVPALPMTNEFAFVKFSPPSETLTSRLTVLSAELTPRVATSPGFCGATLFCQLAAVDQFPVPPLRTVIQVVFVPRLDTLKIAAPPLMERIDPLPEATH